MRWIATLIGQLVFGPMVQCITTQVEWVAAAACLPTCCCWVVKRKLWDLFSSGTFGDGNIFIVSFRLMANWQPQIVRDHSRSFPFFGGVFENKNYSLTNRTEIQMYHAFALVYRESLHLNSTYKHYSQKQKCAESTCKILHATVATYQIQINITTCQPKSERKVPTIAKKMRRKNMNGPLPPRYWAE